MGTLMETDEANPSDGCWLPAGNAWQGSRRGSRVCEEFAGCTIACDGPAVMAKKWSEGLLKPLTADGNGVELDGAVVRFEQRQPGGPDGVVGVDLFAARGRRRAFREIKLCGVRFRLVDRRHVAQSQSRPMLPHARGTQWLTPCLCSFRTLCPVIAHHSPPGRAQSSSLLSNISCCPRSVLGGGAATAG